MKLIFDIETDGLDHTKIWLVTAVELTTGEEFIFTDYEDQYPNLNEFKTLFDKADMICGHNIIGFDLPALEKHTGWKTTNQQIVDTMLLSQLNDFYRPSLDRFKSLSKKGNHAMATWALALGDKKHDDPSWMVYSTEMRERCVSDCHINIKIFRYLMKETSIIKKQSTNYGQAIKLEHEVALDMAEQYQNGWLFDDTAAAELIKTINRRMAVIELEVEPNLEPRTIYIDKKPRASSLLKDGRYDRVTREWFGFESPQAGIAPDEYQRTKEIATDLGNNDAVIKLLYANGWIPTEWNRKRDEEGKWKNVSPKLTEDSYESITGELGAMVGEWRTLRSRRSLLTGLSTLQRADGTIVCDAFVIGTNTFRMRHKGIVNIPGAYAVYGAEIRALFTSAAGRKVVAADSDGNQLRAFAHYLNNPEVSEAICHGDSDLGTDVHTRNANIVGVPRPTAKNLIYALLFGAGDALLGQTADMKGKGKALRAKLMVAFPGFESMMDTMNDQYDANLYETDRGFMTGIDGRKIFCDRFKAFNALLQSYEAVTCKAAEVETMRMVREEGLDAKIICMMHDEVNMDVAECDAARVSEILEYAFGPFVTEKYNLNVPMGGSAKIGDTWFCVH